MYLGMTGCTGGGPQSIASATSISKKNVTKLDVRRKSEVDSAKRPWDADTWRGKKKGGGRGVENGGEAR